MKFLFCGSASNNNSDKIILDFNNNALTLKDETYYYNEKNEWYLLLKSLIENNYNNFIKPNDFCKYLQIYRQLMEKINTYITNNTNDYANTLLEKGLEYKQGIEISNIIKNIHTDCIFNKRMDNILHLNWTGCS